MDFVSQYAEKTTPNARNNAVKQRGAVGKDMSFAVSENSLSIRTDDNKR